MGPSIIVDGERARWSTLARSTRASMGPSIIVDGERPDRAAPFATRGGFNGAVYPRRGRDCSRCSRKARCCHASMGPSIIVDGEAKERIQYLGAKVASMGPSIIVDGELVRCRQ